MEHSIFTYSLIGSTFFAGAWALQENVLAEVSMGDFIDKITILQIKKEKITDSVKLKNVNAEFESLMNLFEEVIVPNGEFQELYDQLLEANKKLWALEDQSRLKESQKEWGKEFIDIMCNIINTNDERSHIKLAINTLLGSHIIEEKSYTDFPLSTAVATDNKTQKHVCIEMPLADIVDRLTILEIKLKHISDPIKRAHIKTERDSLNETLKAAIEMTDEYVDLYEQLIQANQRMWDTQDALRKKDKEHAYDQEFIELGRRNFFTNDLRCSIKRKINLLFGSKLIEEKCYTKY